MRATGIKPRDVIVCCLKNSIDSIIPVLASLYLDAIVLSLNAVLPSSHCAHFISTTKSKLIFVDEDAVSLIETSLAQANTATEVVVVGESSKYKTLSDMVMPREEENEFKPVTVDNCQETAFIYLSSGTTGRPKLICLSHFGLVNASMIFRNVLDAIDSTTPMVSMHFASLYWISTVMIVTASFIKGDTRVVPLKIDGEQILKFIETYKVTYFLTPPSYAHNFITVSNFKNYDVSSLKCMLIAGSRVSPQHLTRVASFFKDTMVTEAYGTTEAGTLTAEISHPRLGSAGKCVEDMEIKVVDVETRKLLGPNENGEVCFRSPYAMKGYYNSDLSIVCDEEGFIPTGDLGYYDDDEYLYLVGRASETFKYRSYFIIPSDIENILEQHPAVKEAIVFGIPHETDGYHAAACIVLEHGANVALEDIEGYLSERVMEYQTLRGGIKFINAIPKSPTGKNLRRSMPEIFEKLPNK
ncbi:hypothetical protein NQ315_006811 [Exocentrus adspersus]|uniref:Uncharacterized protein n=1 Tax=Exocentrus adspersus TaxID=1586481 RepID=A0AAV8WBW0_9CUCU|nr:hypothetical protein NQ315_006811 [Exocentrus adspersus]